jgi:hypothetical protein
MLNDLNCYLLYFYGENLKQLDQDEINEILDQAKARDPVWHEVMVNANIDIFDMSYAGASSSIMLEANTSAPFIKTDDSNTATWSTMGVQLNRTKTEICLWHSLTPEFNLKKQMYSSWAFHVDDRSESSITYEMIISQGEDFLGESGIIMNFNDQTVTWDTDTIPMKDRDACTLSSVDVLIEFMLIWAQMNHKRSAMNILGLNLFLMMIISQQA